MGFHEAYCFYVWDAPKRTPQGGERQDLNYSTLLLCKHYAHGNKKGRARVVELSEAMKHSQPPTSHAPLSLVATIAAFRRFNSRYGARNTNTTEKTNKRL